MRKCARSPKCKAEERSYRRAVCTDNAAIGARSALFHHAVRCSASSSRAGDPFARAAPWWWFGNARHHRHRFGPKIGHRSARHHRRHRHQTVVPGACWAIGHALLGALSVCLSVCLALCLSGALFACLPVGGATAAWPAAWHCAHHAADAHSVILRTTADDHPADLRVDAGWGQARCAHLGHSTQRDDY